MNRSAIRCDGLIRLDGIQKPNFDGQKRSARFCMAACAQRAERENAPAIPNSHYLPNSRQPARELWSSVLIAPIKYKLEYLNNNLTITEHESILSSI
jgi:hypothetical protein